jgi:alanyl-tRNA synthetase
VDGDIRLVEVKDYDWIACCGTHVRRTGEIGIIKIFKAEKYKGNVRVHFVCGSRAFKRLQRQSSVLTMALKKLTLGEEEFLPALDRLIIEQKESQMTIRALQNELFDYEAVTLVQKAKSVNSCRIISSVYCDKDSKSVQQLVKKIIQQKNVICVIGLKADRGFVYVAKSEGIEFDIKPVFDLACSIIEGRGGGSPTMMQCSGQDPRKVDNAVEEAATACINTLSK